jgi:hypothetical protein
MIEKAVDISFHAPGGRGLLAQDLEALVDRIRTPACGPTPRGVGIGSGVGNWLQGLQV